MLLAKRILEIHHLSTFLLCFKSSHALFFLNIAVATAFLNLLLHLFFFMLSFSLLNKCFFNKISINLCRFLFDESSADYKYYEYQLAQEEKAFSETVEPKSSNGLGFSLDSHIIFLKTSICVIDDLGFSHGFFLEIPFFYEMFLGD